jgi:hypothetical protein
MSEIIKSRLQKYADGMKGMTDLDKYLKIQKDMKAIMSRYKMSPALNELVDGMRALLPQVK